TDSRPASTNSLWRRLCPDEDFHPRSTLFSDNKALVGKLQDRLGSLFGHAGKPLQELIDGRAVLEVLEERAHRNACAAKQPRAADLAGHALHHRALTPIEHGLSLRRRTTNASPRHIHNMLNDGGFARTVRTE